ncbi:MAG: cysteine--tRNA ligase [Candidatus Thiodiazotropha lotti]|uniref:Cysteine--tRNA ligase n=1 Tax=Candidatus Thiodiazotropha endoloripes TaxID=1818881 RepID=A0A1E2UPU8_9GAMM|nr:cysteine--tRNA ligase [Candidatus Thiodiazotropha endoloripes]MCG7898238.1 cysteine--tRNA ligase [Candidatus Thiodiazotropha weberae]MCG7992360.1 cysteine--tRNA ligase [Candidatus Thiodiazotropha lotti]MCG7902348.1 cysteine--tRNA ligase [Candidatus Thiodiazotropha weberae]MCG7912804.1 cysteine--tRNA ligase [Candidatus Thiodiazotropha weberae]MCG8000322.1 cysteine--tRNA ligase [Candidatus Thiodiazotropha lotti]
MLTIYNDLTNRKETFQPLQAGKVSMYVCGMTVYDLCHLGHARVMVVFDVVYRYLQANGYDVSYIRNITDVDDKIINRANERGIPFTELTEEFIQAMHQDADALGVLRPTDEPKATQHMDQILAMISRLIEKGHAYAADNGDVYYDVRSFPSYGKLSGKSIEDLQAGARVEPGDAKRDPLDFALWKSAKPEEPAWDSPWGRGRPGWHIECSAMSTNALGNSFDIHGGGADLTFPHHENEIAQSEGATGHPFVKYWMHNGFVRINDEKMSKSLGNFFTVREILDRYQAEEVRYFILTSHYRSPLNYDTEHLDNARGALTRFYTALRGLPEGQSADGESYKTRFHEAMDDDFNTPEALAVLFDLVREINRIKETNVEEAASLGTLLRELGGMLGLLQSDPESYLKGGASTDDGLSDDKIDAMIQARIDARAAKEWGEADRIRDELQDAGIILEDGAEGTTWRRG